MSGSDVFMLCTLFCYSLISSDVYRTQRTRCRVITATVMAMYFATTNFVLTMCLSTKFTMTTTFTMFRQMSKTLTVETAYHLDTSILFSLTVLPRFLFFTVTYLLFVSSTCLHTYCRASSKLANTLADIFHRHKKSAVIAAWLTVACRDTVV